VSPAGSSRRSAVREFHTDGPATEKTFIVSLQLTVCGYLILFCVVVLECVNQADVVFVLDCSGSIDEPAFQYMLDFAATVVNSFDVDGGRVRVGALAFADDVKLAFNLNQYSSRQAVQVGQLSLPSLRGR